MSQKSISLFKQQAENVQNYSWKPKFLFNQLTITVLFS